MNIEYREPTKEIWIIGNANPYINKTVAVKWLKPWGMKETGFEAMGTFIGSFIVGGYTVIGQILIDDPTGNKRRLSCPWWETYLKVKEIVMKGKINETTYN
jgi:hypothetical protein